MSLKKSPVYRWVQRSAFGAKLSGSSCPQPLLMAIKKTSSNALTSEERLAIASIEEVRKSLEENNNVIDIRDYGAGKDDEQRSYEGSDEAVIKHREIGDICRSASKNQLWGQFLFHLIRQFKPDRCVEMGTCLGISASFISSALKLNGSGSLITLEGSPPQSEIARETFRRLGLENVTVRLGRFQDTLVPALNDMRPVNFVFVDGHHDEAATRLYFDTIRPYLDATNVLLFDDIRWSEGMKNAWRYVEGQSEAYNLGPLGLCVNVGASSEETDAYHEQTSALGA